MRLTLFAVAALGALAACADGDVKDPSELLDLSDEEIADALWASMSGYESWGQADGWTGIQYHSDLSPHGGSDFPYMQSWINTTAASDWSDVVGGGSFSTGAILVKNVYDDASGTTTGPDTYAMQKIEGYGSDGWFWAVYDSSGTASALGDVDMCSGCHGAGDDMSLLVSETPGTP